MRTLTSIFYILFILICNTTLVLAQRANQFTKPTKHKVSKQLVSQKQLLNPLVRNSFLPQPVQLALVPYDFDGDGQSDHTVYRSSTSQFFTNNSSSNVSVHVIGSYYSQAVSADIDGDKIIDPGVVGDIGGGFLGWQFIRSSDGSILFISFGLVNDQLVPGDYDGDGIDQIAVYRAGQWYILDQNGSFQQYHYWGIPGDIPVPADYDGDGLKDIAVWRPTDGNWFIINSSDGSASIQQWGLPGDIPVVADWNNDGKADYAVWRPSTGAWFILNSSTLQIISTTQWGLPGDIPVVGDFDGNGVLDFTVYRPSTGVWFHNHRNGQTSMQQFGLPGDELPQQ